MYYCIHLKPYLQKKCIGITKRDIDPSNDLVRQSCPAGPRPHLSLRRPSPREGQRWMERRAAARGESPWWVRP